MHSTGSEILDIIIFFSIPTIPFLVFFIYAMITIAKDKKAAKNS